MLDIVREILEDFIEEHKHGVLYVGDEQFYNSIWNDYGLVFITSPQYPYLVLCSKCLKGMWITQKEYEVLKRRNRL